MKILVVDDHPLMRDVLRTILGKIDRSLVVLEADSAEAARKTCSQDREIDLVLLDPGLPDCRDLDLLEWLRAKHPSLPIVVFSGTEDHATVRRALQLGALGFVPKSSGSKVLVHAVRMALDGEKYLPPMLADAAARTAAVPSSEAKKAERVAAFRLTPRERQVLALRLRYGLHTQEIADVLTARDGKALTDNTVRLHMSNVCKKMSVIDSTEALVVCFERGITPQDLDPKVEAPEDLPPPIRARRRRARP